MATSLLRGADVQARTGMSRSAIYRRMAKGQFPRPVHVGNSLTVRWVEHEVEGWIQETIRADRDAGADMGAGHPKDGHEAHITHADA